MANAIPHASATRRALVLGPVAAGRVIARQLAREGIEATLGPSLPSPAAEDGLATLEAALAAFARSIAPPPPNLAVPPPPLVHPGVGLWGERTEFSTIAQRHGLLAICPPTRVVSYFGDKLGLLESASRLGIPNLVHDYTPIQGIREIERLAKAGEFPLILKSARGTGSQGIQVVREPSELERKIPLWLEQVRLNLGEVFLFAERHLDGARLVLQPFARLADGTMQLFPTVDASLQCRHRKIVEFCPAAALDDGSLKQVAAWTRKLAAACGYVGVGVLEFLVDGPRAFLIDGSARLNLEFALWERVAGTSAVAWQLAALEGSPAPKLEPRREWGAGVLLRFYAEDSLLQLPQPGRVHELGEAREWAFPGSEAELNLQTEQGATIRPRDYGLVGTLIAGARDRKQALTVARGLLDELWVAGSLQTNERFVAELLAHPWVQEGMFHAAFVDEEFLPTIRPSAELLKLCGSLIASVPGLADASADPAGTTVRWVVGDQWSKPDASVVRWVGEPSVFTPESDGGLRGVSGTLELPDGRKARCCAYPTLPGKWQVRVGAWVLGVRRVVTRAGQKPKPRIAALIPGRIHSILFLEGSIVPAHETLAVVESLGMLVPHALATEVRVLKWKVAAEDEVRAGQELAEFEIAERAVSPS